MQEGKMAAALDLESIRQYRSLIKEYEVEGQRISSMEKEIQNIRPAEKEVADVVNKGKKGKKSLGTCVIRGSKDYTLINRKKAKLRERKAKQELNLSNIENMILDIEDAINNINDSETRIMLRYYIVNNKSWEEVAESMGDGYTAEACKKKIQRYFQKK